MRKTDDQIRVTANSTNSQLVNGSTPPGLFVGRYGYPNIQLGPVLPPYYGDTEILDTPELWLGKSLDEIINYRHSLIHGNMRINVSNAIKGGRFIETLQELAMAAKPVDLEVRLSIKPKQQTSFDGDTLPFGPSAPLESFKSSNTTVDRRIEKAYYDKDLKTKNAIISLYENNVLISRIQKALSIGNLGMANSRKIVPTRWSITAVDDTISLDLIEKIKQYPTINEFRVYHLRNLDNIYVAILLPHLWEFEWIEAWFPKTKWNQEGHQPSVIGDHEGYSGRKTYASVGGCYYSTRLSTAEALNREKRQAGALLLREIHPGYSVPVGVWNVRESTREQLRHRPATFDNLPDALDYSFSKLTIRRERWISNSSLIKENLLQKRITDFS